MRLVFNTTLTIDVAPHDDELRRAFIELVCQSARTIYGPAAMLAKSKPILKITETSREGMVDIDLFEPDAHVIRDLTQPVNVCTPETISTRCASFIRLHGAEKVNRRHPRN